MNFHGKFFKYTVSTILILLIIYLAGKLDFVLVPLKEITTIILFPFIGAGLFYYLLRPLVRYLDEKGLNRTVAVTSVFLVIIAFFSILIIYGGGFLRKEFSNFYTTFTQQLQSAQGITQNIFKEEKWWIFSISDLNDKALAALELGFRKLGDNMSSWISTIANLGTVIVLIPFVAFFLLKDEDLFYRNILLIIPKKHKKMATEVLKDIDDALSTYITGQLMVATVLGILTYTGYLIIDLPNALILSLFSMITSIIPFLGPFIGILPAIFIGLTVDFSMIIKILIVLTVVQQLEGNIVSPYIMGNRLHIHPLTVIFLVIISISLYGFIGAFIAIPTYGVIRVIVRHFLGQKIFDRQ